MTHVFHVPAFGSTGSFACASGTTTANETATHVNLVINIFLAPLNSRLALARGGARELLIAEAQVRASAASRRRCNNAPIPRRGLGGLNSPEGVGVTQEPRQARPEGDTKTARSIVIPIATLACVQSELLSIKAQDCGHTTTVFDETAAIADLGSSIRRLWLVRMTRRERVDHLRAKPSEPASLDIPGRRQILCSGVAGPQTASLVRTLRQPTIGEPLGSPSHRISK